MRTVGDVSELAGVTVRTLHHYDEVGVLSPSGRSDAGYRLYSLEDLERLQEILVWRQLGFSLVEIKALLDDAAYDRVIALRRQRALVGGELDRLGAVARALDSALEALANGTEMEVESMFEGFDHEQYEAEGRERWGSTEAYRESARRTGGYGEAEWAEIRAEASAVNAAFAEALAAGEPADGPVARAVAERHREHISRWFYACSPEMHRGLGEMYVSDPRFTETYERAAPGLAVYVRDAIAANSGAVAT
jgi:DNA-binding transcriptional MerR regulator